MRVTKLGLLVQDAIMRFLWSEDNTGFEIKQIVEATGHSDTAIRYRLRCMHVAGLVRRDVGGTVSSKKDELLYVRTDDPRVFRRMSLKLDEDKVYARLPDIWYLTDTGHQLIQTQMID